ncbi:MAG: GC-type dockerin domain-anchored protein [Phycisphaerales bacterium JB039]
MKTLLVIGICAGSAAAQTGVIDQVSEWEAPTPPAQTASFNLSTPSLIWQQQIRAGLDGQLEGIELGVLGPTDSQFTIRIRAGAAWSLETPWFEADVAKSTPDLETIFVDTTSAGIMLSAGDVFVMETQGNGSGVNLRGSYVPPATGLPPLYEEELFLNQNPFADGQWRHGFTTYMLAGGGCYPDCDESGSLDFFDFLCFQNAFAAGDPYADCDGTGALDFFDFLCFQNEFAAGCP